MRITKGKYEKKDGDKRDVQLYVVKENEKYQEGIDLTKLSAEERKNFIKLILDYEEAFDKYAKKAYRSLIKESFLSQEVEHIFEEEEKPKEQENLYGGKGT